MSSERSWVEINLDNFSHNINELKRFMLPGQSFLQIVKADAYGHGAYEIAVSAIKLGAVYLGVANPEEGKLLRIQGIKAPILILSPTLTDEIDTCIENRLTITVSDYSFAKVLNKRATELSAELPVHIKIDTGMHRSGFRDEEFLSIWQKLKKLKNLTIEGIFSHYASSESDDAFTQEQKGRFSALLSQLRPLPSFVHLANSSALLKHNTWQANLVRLGIMSYGVYTDSTQYQTLNLKSVMTFKSTLAQVKDIKQDEYVGYNRTWKADCNSRYGIIPVGYADGYDFLFSNQGIVSIKNQVCRVIGKVSMDMITVDLTSMPKVKPGAEVILMGGGTNLLRAEQLSAKYGGSHYELLCQIGRRAKRYFYRDGKLVSSAPLSRRDFVSTDYSDNKLSRIISSAINQRLQNDEIADLVYKEVLRGFFYNKDNDIPYRSNFVHEIEFSETEDNPDYYLAKTSLSFSKRLQNNYFIVACANSDEVLKRYFMRKDVEYRWQMDTNVTLTSDQFLVTRVRINELELDTQPAINQGCLEIRCSHPNLDNLKDSEVTFSIETRTLYPKASHQMSIFISELTRGVSVSFAYPKHWKNVETVTVFSGQNKYPAITNNNLNKITVSTAQDEWIFPNSGIVFVY